MAAPPQGNVPSGAPEHCPGTASEEAGKGEACQGCPNQTACASAPKGPDPDVAAIAQRLSSIKHKIMVLSGKGGVGKSTIAAQLAFALAAQGREVGLLDIDICGPSMPRMLGLEGQEVHQSGLGWSPVYVADNLGVMSIGFMLPSPDEAVVWRGPRKNGLIKQFLRDVHWGDLDYLVVDAPPGTSDEHITIAQCLQAVQGRDGAVIVTTPQGVAIADVRKEISFCRKVGLPLLGVVENMSGLQQNLQDLRFLDPSRVAPEGGGAGASADATAEVHAALDAALPRWRQLLACSEVFYGGDGGAGRMCRELGVGLLGRVPLDPHLGRACEEGRSVFDLASGAAPSTSLPSLLAIVKKVEAAVGAHPKGTTANGT